MIRYAGYDPTERNYGNTDGKSGPKPKAGVNVGTKARRKPNGAYERRIKNEVAHTKPA